MGELIADVRERVLFLQEMGVSYLAVGLLEAKTDIAKTDVCTANGEKGMADSHNDAARRYPIPEINIPLNSKPAEPRPAPGSRLASLPSLGKRKGSKFFDEYNPPEVESGELRVERSGPETGFHEMSEPTETIEQIRAEIGTDCTRCKLSALGRSQVVNSVGNFNADLMFVGEAPGADEDRLGEPFVGRAGQLLTDIIEKGLGIPRKDVFIGNINRCRPPGNRAPEPDESVVCKPFLLREVAVVRPKVIVVLGATAAQNLLETKTPISKMRGKFHDYLGVKVMPTFHPAYLLRDPHKKREVWEDIKMVRDYLRTAA